MDKHAFSRSLVVLLGLVYLVGLPALASAPPGAALASSSLPPQAVSPSRSLGSLVDLASGGEVSPLPVGADFSFSSDQYIVGEADGVATISVTLSTPLSDTATVDYTTLFGAGPGEAVPGEDYVAVTGTLVFTAGSQIESFDVAILDDDLGEEDEVVGLVLAVANGGPAPTILATHAATLTIQDDDPYRTYLPICARDYCGAFFDNFSNAASGWPVGEDSHVRYGYLSGAYQVLTKEKGWLFLFAAPTCARARYVAETDVRWSGTPGGSYGIMFGMTSGFEYYYLFDMNTDVRQYRVLYRTPGGFQQIVPLANSAAINGGTSSNHLKVTRDGNAIALEVNGAKLGTWSHSGTGGPTWVGLASSSYADLATSDARFDNFRVSGVTGGATVGLTGDLGLPPQSSGCLPGASSAAEPLAGDWR